MAVPGTSSRAQLSLRTAGVLGVVERRAGVTPAGVVLALLVVPGLLLGRVLGSPSVFLLVYGAVAVLGLSRLLARRRLQVEAVRSTLPRRIRVDQPVDVELTVRTRRRLATVVLEEELPEAFGTPIRLPVPVLPVGQTVEHGYRFTARRRGVFQVGPLVAEWSDPFGLTRKRVQIAPAETVIVHPNTESVRDRITSREWEDPPIRPPQSKPWPSGFEFYGMRDYVSGDDPRRIIWTASAKTDDRYLVRESEQGITDRVTLLLDNDREHHSPGDPSETFERAVRAVASLGVRHLADGFSVTVDSNTERLGKALRGPRARIPLLDRMAEVQLDGVPLAKSLERLFLDRQRNTHNVLVTPHLDADAARRIRILLERGTSVLLVLLLWEDTDSAMLHRAGSLGCNVVELRPDVSFERTFARVVGAGGR
ncbi:MAG: DUF58 domain-containing protein [Mycobacteriales bacterium]